MKNAPNSRNFLHSMALLGAGAASMIAGCQQEKNATHTKAKEVLSAKQGPTKEDPKKAETAKEDATWTRFRAISEDLERRGATVRWNHPPEGPKDPFFVVPSAHLHPLEVAQGTQDKEEAMRIAEEYMALRMLGKAGLRKFAFEGARADRNELDCNVIAREVDKDRYSFVLTSLPPEKRPPLSPDQFVLTPKEVREQFSDIDFTARFIGNLRGNIAAISAELMKAGTDPEAGYTFIGAERPETYEDFVKFAACTDEREIRDTIHKFFDAKSGVKKADDTSWFELVKSAEGTVTQVRIGKEVFDATELRAALLTEIGESEEHRKIHDDREAFICDELGAQVVHFGSAHLKQFIHRKTSRSVGVIIPPSAKAKYNSFIDGTDNISTLLKALEVGK